MLRKQLALRENIGLHSTTVTEFLGEKKLPQKWGSVLIDYQW